MPVPPRPAARPRPRTPKAGGEKLLARSDGTPPADTRDGDLAARRRKSRREVRLALAMLLVILAALFVHGDTRVAAPASKRTPGVTLAVPASPDEIRMLLTTTARPIAPTDALALNAARPLDLTPANFARPFFIPAAGTGPAAALECLTQAIYYEAASESETGQRAVAQVVLNRMRSPIFPHTVCGVVYQGSQQRTGCQFSFTCDGSLARRPSIGGWAQARRIALAALSGSVERSVGLSTHYHANYVVPYWAGSLDKVATIGAHIFYTMRGGLGRPVGFGERYNAGAEAMPTVDPALDPTAEAAAELVGGDRTGETGNPAGLMLPNRTVVKDDALGAVAKPNLAPVAPQSGLRADERRGELVVDKNTGTLKSTR